MGKLAVKKRKENGTRACMRLREQGLVPGNMYGHKQDPTPFTVPAPQVLTILHAGNRVVEVDCEGHKETAVVREVQWDTFGKHLMHLDLIRVDPNEKVTVDVRIELRRTAPGALGGGLLDHELRSVTLECLVIQIPDSCTVKIGALDVGQAIHVRELELPPNTRCLNHSEDVVVQVLAKSSAPIPTSPTEGPAAPEVIKKPAKEGAEEVAAEGKKK